MEGTNCRVANSTYDNDGNLTSRTVSGYEPDGTPISRTTTWQYNGPYGQLSQIDGPRTDISDMTTLEYYPDTASAGHNRGRLKTVTLANGLIQRDNIQYNAVGKVLSEDRPNGLSLTYTYYTGNDRLNTVTTSQGSDAQTTQFTYIATGEVATITTAHGTPEASTTTFSYDAAKQLTRITDDAGNYMTYRYDSEGNQTGESVYDTTGSLKRSLTKTYDRFNRLNETQRNFNSDDSDFDVDGTLDTFADGRGTVTDYNYDTLKRLTQTIQDLGNLDITTEYVYDVADRLVKVKDPEDLETLYEYDDLGNLLKVDSPDTGITTYTYDAAGNRTSQTDANGITIHYSYDALNRLTLIDYPNDTDVTYTYDENTNGQNGIGKLTTVTDASGTTTYAYDARGNLESETRIQDGLTFTTRYAYNTRDEMVQVIYPSGRSVDYTRNSLGQVSNITTSVNGNHQTIVSNIGYLPFGPINALTYGNGMTHSRTYDTDYRLTGRIDSGVLDYAYTRDAAGNITEHTNITEIGFCDGQFCGSAVTLDINRYQYDTVHRLTQSDMNSDIEAFSYDALGNRLSRTHNGASRQYFYGLEDHRLRQIANGTVHSFTHDALGNTLSTHSHTFSYGDNHRLVSVEDPSSNLLATYTYNAQNLRTKKVAATSTYYHYNQEGQLISESDNSGNITREYMYLNGSPIAMSDTNGLHYLHSDHLGTPKVMTDSQQDIVWQATHTAFGEARTDEDPDGDGVNVRLNIRFPGQYYDEETNLHYNWNRYYDPAIGRYITSDPIGLAGGINTYGYVGGNPIKFTDIYGLAKDSITARIEALAARGDIQSLRNLANSGGLNPTQQRLIESAIRSTEIVKKTTSSPRRLAEILNRKARDIKKAIERCKQQGLPRNGPQRNPDVRVDPVTGEVYPKLPNGQVGDSIGNIFDFL